MIEKHLQVETGFGEITSKFNFRLFQKHYYKMISSRNIAFLNIKLSQKSNLRFIEILLRFYEFISWIGESTLKFNLHFRNWCESHFEIYSFCGANRKLTLLFIASFGRYTSAKLSTEALSGGTLTTCQVRWSTKLTNQFPFSLLSLPLTLLWFANELVL